MCSSNRGHVKELPETEDHRGEEDEPAGWAFQHVPCQVLSSNPVTSRIIPDSVLYQPSTLEAVVYCTMVSSTARVNYRPYVVLHYSPSIRSSTLTFNPQSHLSARQMVHPPHSKFVIDSLSK